MFTQDPGTVFVLFFPNTVSNKTANTHKSHLHQDSVGDSLCRFFLANKINIIATRNSYADVSVVNLIYSELRVWPKIRCNW